MSKGIHVLAPVLLLVAWLGIHCGGGGSATPSTASGTSAPIITGFNATPATIAAGQSTILTGVFSNGTGTIDNAVGTVASGTGVTVAPVATTTYTLTVTSSTGTSITQSATVTVLPAGTPIPTITSFSASPTSIPAGQSATLTGVFSNGTGTVDNAVGTVTSGTGVKVTPATTTTYTLTVTASGVSITQPATVTVVAASMPSTTATPVIIAPASLATGLTGAVTITATVPDPTGVAAVDSQIDGADLGSAPTAPYTFTLPSTAAYTSGQHVFQARSRDAAGTPSPWSQPVVVSFGGTVALPSGFAISALTGTLTAATAMGVAPDGRIFVCEQGGTLRIFKTGALLPTPFATLPTTANDERGLLGVTFDPQFGTNGYVYVYYTASSPTIHNRISRLTADPATPDQMLAGSELALVDLPTLLATNHNGGALHFGPDGKLYAAVGNNAVNANSPSFATPLGKILRLNPDGTIPADNPFVATTTGINQAIWALGLRNPFTFGFQPGSTRMHINDVGENTWEEVNLGAAGANYGWPSTEGPTTAAGITGPIFAYGHPSLPPGQPASKIGRAHV